jgi:[acyl-carrier-protein] S-malonyltransferase
VLAILAPGQGAQKSGFLNDWLGESDVRTTLERLAAAAETDLVAAGTILSDLDITDTAIAQPLIVAASLATAQPLGPLPTGAVFAGHSVGEFAAAALAGFLTAETAMRLVATRGRAMAAASRCPESGMAAVLGGDRQAVLTAIERSGCVAANDNGPGQVVAAGPVAALDRLAAEPPPGARVRRLPVAGAFHSELMASARIALAEAAEWVTPADSPTGLVSNRDGMLVTGGEDLLTRLIAQVCEPVRWGACTRTLAALGVTGTIELAPGGTLTGLVRRALPEVEAVALRTPADLPAARRLIAEHGTDTVGEVLGTPPTWRLLVAPEGGTVRLPGPADPVLAAGAVVARVSTRAGELVVTAGEGGRLLELLVHDGDPVGPGQPLARLAPVEA